MEFLSTMKLTPVFLDLAYNPPQFAMDNLFEIFVLLARRFDAMINVLFRDVGEKPSGHFLETVVKTSVRKIQGRIALFVRRGIVETRREEVEWVFAFAFHTVLKENSGTYGSHSMNLLKKLLGKRSMHGNVDKCHYVTVYCERRLDQIKSSSFIKFH